VEVQLVAGADLSWRFALKVQDYSRFNAFWYAQRNLWGAV